MEFMKKMLPTLCLIPTLIWGVVFESSHMEDLLPYVEEGTWVLFDIDNTLIESCTHLGSDQWCDHIRTKVHLSDYTEESTEPIVNNFWDFVQPFVDVRLIDPNAANVVQKLKDSNIPVFALTARWPHEKAWTRRQLHSVNLCLTSTHFPERITLPFRSPAAFIDGVLYCGENGKDKPLIGVLLVADELPKRIVFVDDSQDHVDALQELLEVMEIEYVGMRFNGADARVKAFDGEVADLQYALLPLSVSDDEAKGLLQGIKK